MNTKTFEKIVEKSKTVRGNGIITLQSVIKFLKEDGWNVSAYKSVQTGSGVKYGRMMLRAPGERAFTKVIAEKDGVTVTRSHADDSVSMFCWKIVNAYNAK